MRIWIFLPLREAQPIRLLLCVAIQPQNIPAPLPHIHRVITQQGPFPIGLNPSTFGTASGPFYPTPSAGQLPFSHNGPQGLHLHSIHRSSKDRVIKLDPAPVPGPLRAEEVAAIFLQDVQGRGQGVEVVSGLEAVREQRAVSPIPGSDPQSPSPAGPGLTSP